MITEKFTYPNYCKNSHTLPVLFGGSYLLHILQVWDKQYHTTQAITAKFFHLCYYYRLHHHIEYKRDSDWHDFS